MSIDRQSREWEQKLEEVSKSRRSEVITALKELVAEEGSESAAQLAGVVIVQQWMKQVEEEVQEWFDGIEEQKDED